MDEETLIASLERIEERANQSLDNGSRIREFIEASGNSFFFETIERPESFVAPERKTEVERRIAPDGSIIIKFSDGTFERE